MDRCASLPANVPVFVLVKWVVVSVPPKHMMVVFLRNNTNFQHVSTLNAQQYNTQNWNTSTLQPVCALYVAFLKPTLLTLSPFHPHALTLSLSLTRPHCLFCTRCERQLPHTQLGWASYEVSRGGSQSRATVGYSGRQWQSPHVQGAWTTFGDGVFVRWLSARNRASSCCSATAVGHHRPCFSVARGTTPNFVSLDVIRCALLVRLHRSELPRASDRPEVVAFEFGERGNNAHVASTLQWPCDRWVLRRKFWRQLLRAETRVPSNAAPIRK